MALSCMLTPIQPHFRSFFSLINNPLFYLRSINQKSNLIRLFMLANSGFLTRRIMCVFGSPFFEINIAISLNPSEHRIDHSFIQSILSIQNLQPSYFHPTISSTSYILLPHPQKLNHAQICNCTIWSPNIFTEFSTNWSQILTCCLLVSVML